MVYIWLIQIIIFTYFHYLSCLNRNYYDNLSLYIANNDCYLNRQCLHSESKYCLGSKVLFKEIGVIKTYEYPKNSDWSVLKHIPECWPHFQQFYCANYFAKCENEKVIKPIFKTCKLLKHSCRFLLKRFYPPFLTCDYHDSPSCSYNENVINNTFSNKCIEPLIYSENVDAWYFEIDKCAYPCQSAIFTYKQNSKLVIYIRISNIVCICITCIIIILFILAKRKEGLLLINPIIYSLFCNIILNISIFISINNKSNRRINCYPDLSLLMSNSKNISCNLSFTLIYFSTIASFIWYMNFNLLGLNKSIDITKLVNLKCSQKFKYHLVSWITPFGLLLITYSFVRIHGNYMLGFCFIDAEDPLFDICFTYPLMIVCLLGLVFSCKSLRRVKMLQDAQHMAVNTLLHDSIWWLSCLLILFVLFIIKNSILYVHKSWYHNVFSQYLWCNISTKIFPDLIYHPKDKWTDDGCQLQRLDDIKLHVIGIILYTLLRIAVPIRILITLFPTFKHTPPWIRIKKKSVDVSIDSDPNNDSDCDYEASDELVGPIFGKHPEIHCPNELDLHHQSDSNDMSHMINTNQVSDRFPPPPQSDAFHPPCPFCVNSNIRSNSLSHSLRNTSIRTSWTSGTLSIYRAQREKMTKFLANSPFPIPNMAPANMKNRWSSYDLNYFKNARSKHLPHTISASTLPTNDLESQLSQSCGPKKADKDENPKSLSSKAQAIFERRKMFRRYCRYVKKSKKQSNVHRRGRRSSVSLQHNDMGNEIGISSSSIISP